MADNQGLRVAAVVVAGCGVPDVPNGNFTRSQPVQNLMVKHFRHKPQILMGDNNTVVVDSNTAAFLPPVLEGVQGGIGKGGNVMGLFRVVNAENATFFMEFVEQIFSPHNLSQ